MELEVLQPKQEGRADSFWYDGVIARLGEFTLIAVGDIRIVMYEADGSTRIYRDGQAVDEARGRGYVDADLYSIERVAEWYNNNWFEVIHPKDGGETLNDVEWDYDAGIAVLKDTFQSVCPKCLESFRVHNDDGSCVKD